MLVFLELWMVINSVDSFWFFYVHICKKKSKKEKQTKENLQKQITKKTQKHKTKIQLKNLKKIPNNQAHLNNFDCLELNISEKQKCDETLETI